MKRRTIRMLALVAALLPTAVGAALADDDATPSSTTSSALTPSEFAMPVAAPDGSAPMLAEHNGGTVDRVWESIRAWPRERPRYRDYNESRGTGAVSQVHAGFFDPTGDLGTGLVLGFRIGPEIDPHVQLGAAVDWWHKTEEQTIKVAGGSGPGGIGVEREIQLSSSSANLVPLLGYVQVGGDASMQVIPYVGAGAGFEWLNLNGDDPSGNSFEANYGGFGWQLWGGVAVPLSGRARFNAEVFGNGAELGRDVDFQDSTGATLTGREIVKMNGVGMRAGVSWGF